jgi:ribosome-associated protein
MSLPAAPREPMATELKVSAQISIPESELEEDFILSSGAGGQNVNKVASAVQLRFDVLHSPSLPDDVRVRLLKLAGHRLTKDGVLIVAARESRDQVRNREIARQKLAELIRAATRVPKKRKPTKPTRAAKERRIDSKKHHARTKRQRAKRFED